ncbi:MAG: hypothetical protein A2046_01345 [Bacteroidetes bacterium GWA2_30_7]|nr:MAG: hypothetical protein A2046_01345 [Bacteroidetes bacterium GWA2_30_7]
MYKVFYNDRTVYITDDVSKYIKNHDGIFAKYVSKSSLKICVDKFLKNEQIKELFLFYHDFNELDFIFRSIFTQIDAAGGVVKNNKNQILAIFRNNKWDLPKGKVEKNEDFKQAAIREVCEECGISDVVITETLKPTFHIYKINDNWVLKKTYWFEMKYEKDEKLKPQLKENITEVKWFNNQNLNIILQNSYSSIKEVLNETTN